MWQVDDDFNFDCKKAMEEISLQGALEQLVRVDAFPGSTSWFILVDPGDDDAVQSTAHAKSKAIFDNCFLKGAWLHRTHIR